MTAVKEGSEPHALGQRLHDEITDPIVRDHAGVLEVHRKDRLVHAVLLIAVRVNFLGAMSGEVKEKSVPGSGSFHQPLQSILDVAPRGFWSRAVIRQPPDAIPPPAEPLDQEARSRAHVVDAASELGTSAPVVDANQQGASAAGRPESAVGGTEQLCSRIERRRCRRCRSTLLGAIFVMAGAGAPAAHAASAIGLESGAPTTLAASRAHAGVLLCAVSAMWALRARARTAA
mmetsp:Transcript_36597/g.105450  ORF Transcript_36597/g.105450 Transcript_36597/m.105450 type:complete len:231 (+) Transcript_36597:633-1325(+)